MSPTAVVAAQMDALQMNDWPETDAGARTAFAFTKPHDAESPTRAPVSHCPPFRCLHAFLTICDMPLLKETLHGLMLE